MKTYVIGDVHGCYYTLMDLIEKLPVNSNLIFVGDLCDRGLHTKKVFDYIIDNGHRVILGNHDKYMMLHGDEVVAGNTEPWFAAHKYLGIQPTLDSYKDDMVSFKKHIDFIKTMPEYIIEGEYFITHGFGLPYYLQRDAESRDEGLYKCRTVDEGTEWSIGWDDNYMSHPVTNIFGHNIYPEVETGPNKKWYGIDTGVCRGYKLTALELDSMKVFDQKTDSRDLK